MAGWFRISSHRSFLRVFSSLLCDFLPIVFLLFFTLFPFSFPWLNHYYNQWLGGQDWFVFNYNCFGFFNSIQCILYSIFYILCRRFSSLVACNAAILFKINLFFIKTIVRVYFFLYTKLSILFKKSYSEEIWKVSLTRSDLTHIDSDMTAL